jgi:hypothetical protein
MVNLVLPPAPVEEHEEHKKGNREHKSSGFGLYFILLLILIGGLWYLLSQGYLSSYLP